MERCDRCGKEFKEEIECEKFESETGLVYDNLALTLCAECAIDAMDVMESGVYFKTCEKCGETYDWLADDAAFEAVYGQTPKNLFGTYICFDCAEEAYVEYQEELLNTDWMDDEDDE